MSEEARISEDGLSLRLDAGEARELAEKLAEPTARAGFARRECIRGKHPVGTERGCPACEGYKGGVVVRKF
jgi:hypothetical protein